MVAHREAASTAATAAAVREEALEAEKGDLHGQVRLKEAQLKSVAQVCTLALDGHQPASLSPILHFFCTLAAFFWCSGTMQPLPLSVLVMLSHSSRPKALGATSQDPAPNVQHGR